MKKEKRCDTPDFMAELNGDSDETAADLANLERFISEDTSDGIINADTFKDLISEIHDLPPEFMEEFDFDTTDTNIKSGVGAGGLLSDPFGAPLVSDGSRAVDSIVSRLKQEEVEAADREIQAAMLDIGKSMSMNAQSSSSSSSCNNNTSSSILTTSITTSSCSTATLSSTSTGSFNNNNPSGIAPGSFADSTKSNNTPPIQQHQQQQQQQRSVDNSAAVAGGGNGMNNRQMPQPFGVNSGGPELSPAALTLKQMAEQHQHKAQMGMTPAAMNQASTGLSAPPTMANQGAPLVPPHHPPVVNNMRMRGNFQDQQHQQQPQQQPQYNNPSAQGPVQQQQQQQQQTNQFMNRTPYTGQGGYGPNSPMIKKEMPYFANSPLGGNSPGPGRPVQQQHQQGIPGSQQQHQVPGAKSSPVPMSQTSPMGPPTPQQMQQQQQQQQFNVRKAPTPTSTTASGNNTSGNSGRTPPPSAAGGNPANVQFSQTQQQQMHMSSSGGGNNGQQIQVIPILTRWVCMWGGGDMPSFLHDNRDRGRVCVCSK